MAYKSILQSANEKIKITVSRENNLLQLNLKPKSIFKFCIRLDLNFQSLPLRHDSI